ncbi:MAG: hypothetical protein NZ853_01540 [Leptospiraceae bacterium]|nr:hypothetical protein [Leptospiraceae bacterium]MDW7976089.1 hypothetical protein [Leptospiraceae bacterium]
MKKIKLKLMVSLIIAFLFLPIQEIKGQFYCVGNGCSLLPLDSVELTNAFQSLRTQYINEFLSDMSTANIYTMVNTIPSGIVNLQEFTIGINVILSETKLRKIDIRVPNYGVIEDVPSKGVGLVPNAFIGFNVGYLFSGDPKPINLKWYSPHRFDIFVSYLNAVFDDEKANATRKNEAWEVKSKTWGADLRYHLIEGNTDTNWLLGFSGISLGIGYHNVNQSIEYVRKNHRFVFNATDKVDVIWRADNEAAYSSKINVYTIDIRTGIQLLYLFRFSVGVGHAWVKGSSDIIFQRFGPVVVESDLLKLFGIEPPNANLGLVINGEGKTKRNQLTYLSAGFELNIPLLKIFIDAKGTKDNYSASAGIRIAL